MAKSCKNSAIKPSLTQEQKRIAIIEFTLFFFFLFLEGVRAKGSARRTSQGIGKADEPRGRQGVRARESARRTSLGVGKAYEPGVGKVYGPAGRDDI